MNQPITEGHFVVIDNKAEELPWLQSTEAARNSFFNDEVPIRYQFSCIVGCIQG